MNTKPEKEQTKPEAKTQSNAEIYAEARRRFNDLMSLEYMREREMCLEDRKFAFVPGEQWDDYDDEDDNTIKLEMNLSRKSLLRIHSDYRNNPISVDFVPIDDAQSDDLADACDGLFRNDMNEYGGEEAFHAAFEEGTAGGIGAWRLLSVYEDEDDDENDRQRIAFEPIYDADQCCFWDPNAKRKDKRDAMWGMLISKMTHDAYREKYSEDPTSWPATVRRYGNFDYVTSSHVAIMEYFRIEKDTQKVVVFINADGENKKINEDDLTENVLMDLTLSGWEEVRTRNVTRRKLMKYTMSGAKILDRGQRLAGKYIPLIPFYGHRVVVEGIERVSGHIRMAKDPQRLENLQVSNLAEIASRSPVQKPIVTPEQIEGHENDWADDIRADNPYLLLNPMTDGAGNSLPSGPIAYTKSPDIPPALAAVLQYSGEKLKGILGNEQSEEIRSNIGVDVVEQIHAKLEMQSYIYVSNMAASIAHCGRVWMSMASELYVEDGRTMKTVTKSKETNTVILGQKKDVKGEIVQMTLKNAKLSVSTDVAPSSSSRRTATVRNTMKMMAVTQDPETVNVLGLTAIMNSEGEGMSDIRDWARMKLVRMNIITPSDDEAEKLKEEAQNQKPDASHNLLMAEAEKAKAQTIEAQARAKAHEASAKKADADAMAIMAAISREERAQVLDIMRQLDESDKNTAPATP